MQASIATSNPSLKLPTKVTHDLHLSGAVLVLAQEGPTQWEAPQSVTLLLTLILRILQNCFLENFLLRRRKSILGVEIEYFMKI